MYKLLKPISKGLEVLVREVESHIKQQGMQSVLSLKNDPSVSVQFILTLVFYKTIICSVIFVHSFLLN